MEAHLVDRTVERETLRGGLQRAAEGKGNLLLLRGEAGIGKTRLLEEALTEARRMGFETGRGTALPEAADLYHPWAEALRPMGMDHLLLDETPPRLLGLYLLSHGGRLLARAERSGLTSDPELFGAMSSAVTDFLHDAFTRTAEASEAQSTPSSEGRLLRFAYGARGICVFRSKGFALSAVLEGRESELFLEELHTLAGSTGPQVGDAMREWDGSTRATAHLEAPLRAVLESGKYDGVDLAADGQARKYNLYDNVLFGLRRRAAIRPLLVALDDLQWADPSTMGLLHYIARNVRADRILLMGAYRVEELPMKEHLRDAMLEMSREGLGTDIHIGPLPPPDTRALATHLIGPNALPDGFFDTVVRETEGNPLFVREALRELRDEGALRVDSSTGEVHLARPLERLDVPARVRDVVARRLGRLGTGERALLDAASVCGTRFTGALAAALLGEAEAKVVRELTVISRVHSLVRPVEKRWMFFHPVVREVLYAELPGELRAIYHRAAGEALGRAGAPAAEVGEHFASAGDARAVAHLRRAAATAITRGVPEEAARLLRLALETAAGAERAALEEARAEALELSGQYEEALKAVAGAGAAGAQPARCAGRRVAILENLSRWGEAVRVASEGLPGAAPEDAAHLLERRASVKVRLGQFNGALTDAEEALRLYPPEEKAGRGNVLNTIGTCYGYQGKYDRALDFYSRALRLREEAGDRRGVAYTLNNIGVIYFTRGDLDAALEHHRLSMARKEAIGDRRGVAYTLNNIGELLVMRGDLAQALEHCRRSLAVCEAMADRFGMASALADIGNALTRSGDTAGALEVLGRAVTLCRDINEKHMRVAALVRSVPSLIGTGRAAAARECAEEALRLARETGSGPEEGYAVRAMGEVEAASGNMEEARRHFAGAVGYFEAQWMPLEVAETHRSWGLAARAAGHADEAQEQLETSAELFGACNLRKRVDEVRAAIADFGF